jgi:hypothetical protein
MARRVGYANAMALRKLTLKTTRLRPGLTGQQLTSDAAAARPVI